MKFHILNIGDKIASIDNGSHKTTAIREVSRVTNTLAFCKISRGGNSYELKFPREVSADGIFTEKGDTPWNKDWFRLASESDFQQVHEGNLRVKVSRIDWSQVSTEKIKQVLDLLAQ